MRLLPTFQFVIFRKWIERKMKKRCTQTMYMINALIESSVNTFLHFSYKQIYTTKCQNKLKRMIDSNMTIMKLFYEWIDLNGECNTFLFIHLKTAIKDIAPNMFALRRFLIIGIIIQYYKIWVRSTNVNIKFMYWINWVDHCSVMSNSPYYLPLSD